MLLFACAFVDVQVDETVHRLFDIYVTRMSRLCPAINAVKERNRKIRITGVIMLHFRAFVFAS